MSTYIGVRCPVCNKKFTESDDIVVCPICGAPHHRDCYFAQNQCAFSEDHLSGKEWENPMENAQDEHASTNKTCQKCGAFNPPEGFFCQSCGSPFPIAQQKTEHSSGFSTGHYSFPVDSISMAYGGLPPDEEIQGERVHDIARYVGSGSAYYLPRFYILGKHARAITFNLFAVLFGSLYYIYRKMYWIGAFLMVIFLLSCIPSMLYSWEVFPSVLHEMGFVSGAVEVNVARLNQLDQLSNVTRMIDIAIRVIVSFMANRSYFTRSIAAIKGVRLESEALSLPREEYEHRLMLSGGTNKLAVILVVVGLGVLLFSISGMLAMQYMPSI